MTISEAIQYLQPIADSASLPRYSDALNTAIDAMQELEITREFIHEQGLEFSLIGVWDKYKNHIGTISQGRAQKRHGTEGRVTASDKGRSYQAD